MDSGLEFDNYGHGPKICDPPREVLTHKVLTLRLCSISNRILINRKIETRLISILRSKKFWVKNCFGAKKFFGPKKFWVKKIFGSKNFWVKKFVGSKICLSKRRWRKIYVPLPRKQ